MKSRALVELTAGFSADVTRHGPAPIRLDQGGVILHGWLTEMVYHHPLLAPASAPPHVPSGHLGLHVVTPVFDGPIHWDGSLIDEAEGQLRGRTSATNEQLAFSLKRLPRGELFDPGYRVTLWWRGPRGTLLVEDREEDQVSLPTAPVSLPFIPSKDTTSGPTRLHQVALDLAMDGIGADVEALHPHQVEKIASGAVFERASGRTLGRHVYRVRAPAHENLPPGWSFLPLDVAIHRSIFRLEDQRLLETLLRERTAD